MRNLFKPRNLLMIVVVLAVMLGGAILFPVPLPTILLPAEVIFSVAGFPVTNTLITTLIADITLLVIAFAVGRNLKEIPTGFQNLIEWFLETFYRMTEDIAGKVNAKRWFPVFITIMMFLMVANWWELIPGFDSIGVIEPIEVATAHTNGTDNVPLPAGVIQEAVTGVTNAYDTLHTVGADTVVALPMLRDNVCTGMRSTSCATGTSITPTFARTAACSVLSPAMQGRWVRTPSVSIR